MLDQPALIAPAREQPGVFSSLGRNCGKICVVAMTMAPVPTIARKEAPN